MMLYQTKCKGALRIAMKSLSNSVREALIDAESTTQKRNEPAKQARIDRPI